MKQQKVAPLPTQDVLGQQDLAILDLGNYTSELSGVPHHHDAYMLMYVQDAGSGSSMIDFRHYEMPAGRLFLFSSGQAHQQMADRVQGKSVVFSEAFMQSTGITAHDAFVLFSSVYQHPYLDLNPKLQHYFFQLTGLMEMELKEAKPNQGILSRYLYILLNYLIQECHLQISLLTPKRHSERLFRLSSLIELHYSEHKSIQFYADALDITAKHLNSLCRDYLGKTVAEMQHERLLIESKRLLYFSSLSIKEIAYRLGFEDASYFVRFFRRLTGLTPAHFREEGAKSTIGAADNPAS
jgi:AraC family transcriptional activator of pobA